MNRCRLCQALPIKPEFRAAKGQLRVEHARVNNLKDVSVNVPVSLSIVPWDRTLSGLSTSSNITAPPFIGLPSG